MRLLLLGLGIAAACLAAGAGDVDRIQGVITELHPQGFILATEGRTVVVDMSALGGITMALAAPMVFTPLLTYCERSVPLIERGRSGMSTQCPRRRRARPM